MVAATGSGTSASSKKSDAEGKGGTGAKAGAGGSKGPAGGGKMGAKSSQAGGVKKDTKSPAKTSDRTSLSKSPAPSKPKDTTGTGIGGLLGSRFKDPGVLGVPGGLEARNQKIIGKDRLIDFDLGPLSRRGVTPDQPFGKMKAPAIANAIAFADSLRAKGYGPFSFRSTYRSQAIQDAIKARNPEGVRKGDIAKSGEHVAGTAFDATVPGMTPAQLVREALAFGGFGRIRGYGPQGHVHFGTKPSPTGKTIVSGRFGPGSLDPRGSRKVADFAAAGRTGLPAVSSEPSLPSSVARPSPAGPSLPSVARPAPVDPRASINAAPRPKPSNFESEALTRSVLAGLGVNPARSFPSRPTPNMNMGGYGYGPMASVGGMPPARGNMTNMGPSYASPMTGLSGMPQAPSRMNMDNYNSPMASVGGLPGAVTSPGKIQDRLEPEQAPAPRPSQLGPGLLASPNVNLDRFRAPPSKTQDRLAPEVAEQPRNPIGGMSFNPAPPRNPIGGMSFTPGLPRNPISGMSFNPNLPGMMPGPDRSISPFVGEEEPQVAQRGNRPRALGLENYQGPMQEQPDEPVVARNSIPGWGAVKSIANSAIDAVTPSPETQEKLRMAFDWGRFITPPGPNNPTSRGGQGGVDKPPIQWTGREPPQLVAEMQQHVEEVLRSILAPQPTLG